MLRPEFKAISNIVKAYGEKLKKHKASVVEAWPCFPFFWGGGKGYGSFQFSGFGFFGWRLVDTVLNVFYVTFISYVIHIRLDYLDYVICIPL